MSLAKYKKMRRFSETPEPEGKLAKSGKKLQFVIQKHHASRLHYDLRLEMDGVMKSWAVPKGPQLDPKTKRLAMHVEDHPIEYNKFEGVIPEGHYGAGNVIIWDRGWYEPDVSQPDWPKTSTEGYKKGEVKFILHGEKLHGSFALIKTPHMGDNAWLLIKHKDKYVSTKDITEEDKSVVSGKTVDEIGGGSEAPDPIRAKASNRINLKALSAKTSPVSGKVSAGAPKAKILRGVKPMLATLVDEPFDDDEWLFELKWDGYRAIAAWDGKKVELYSRNGLDFSKKYPAVVETVRGLKNQVVLDGEVVALDSDGHPLFEWLQNYSREPKGQLVYYVFDLLWLDGHDLREWPLTQRKAALEQILPTDSIIRYSDHIEAQGKAFYKQAEKNHLEGIMAKAAKSLYKEGYRSKQWLKIKTHLRQEAVIGGFTEPRGSRKEIGALVLGVYEKGELKYVGHTGGGIPPTQLKPLRTKLEKIEVEEAPFNEKVKPNAPVHWVKPKYVCEVSFAEWTGDWRMRQPIFVGMRPDKAPKDVHIEKPKAVKT